MPSLRHLLALLSSLWLIVACDNPSIDLSDTWHMSQHEQDSVIFAETHHFTIGFNFVLASDSLQVKPAHPAMPHSSLDSTYTVFKSGDQFVVADIVTIHSDSIPTEHWIKVARDQMSIGWVAEGELLTTSTPTDSISRVIHAFSHKHLFGILFIIMSGILFGLCFMLSKRPAAQLKHLFTISPYPVGLTMIAALCASLYGGIQCFCPDIWNAFYFHPTINPFYQPWPISALLCAVWLYLIVGIATIDELRNRLSGIEAMAYLFFMASVHVMVYLVFSLSTQYYIGYLLWPTMAYALWRFNAWAAPSLRCGHCHQPISQLGHCPHCGTFNQ